MVRGEDTDIADVAVRIGERSDVAFIFSRALRDLRNCPTFHGVPDGLYHQYMHRALEHTLTRANILVAYPGATQAADMVTSGDTRKILGFVVADPTKLGLIVHYAFTRKSYNEHGTLYENYQRRGICAKLIEAMRRQYEVPSDKVFYTLKTPMFKYEKPFRVMLEKDPRFTYNPFLFWTLLPQHWEMGIRKPSQRHFATMALDD